MVSRCNPYQMYINALSGIYNALHREHQFVPSSEMRFPEFNMYFSHVEKRYKVIEAIEQHNLRSLKF